MSGYSEGHCKHGLFCLLDTDRHTHRVAGLGVNNIFGGGGGGEIAGKFVVGEREGYYLLSLVVD